jgi:3-methylfumaryl-CoA hydratase
VLLFRYSALTFNSHRIHYDYPYATHNEGYEGLVVHSPLQATLLLNAAAVLNNRVPRRFTYRGNRPLIAGVAREVCAVRIDTDSVNCWTRDASGAATW